MTHRDSTYERFAFKLSVLLSVCLHLLTIAIIIGVAMTGGEPKYKPLAVMDFSYYDPEGGSPGGGEGDEPSSGPEPGPGEPIAVTEAEEPETPPQTEMTEPEPEPEPEPAPELTEAPEVISSTSEEASPLPPPPAAAEEKKEEKPKPKPKKPKTRQAETKPAENAAAKSPGGAEKGEVKTGGGQGSGKGGVGDGKGKGNPNALNAYASKVRSKLNRLKKYPSAAASKKISGVVTVNFTINRQGAVTSSRLVKSSGHSVLDQEVMALLKRCSPFPAMPIELPQTTLNLTVPIRFDPPR